MAAINVKLDKISDKLPNGLRNIISDGQECKMRQFHPRVHIFFHQKLGKSLIFDFKMQLFIGHFLIS